MTRNFNLPPGLLLRDVDKSGQECPACEGSGEIEWVDPVDQRAKLIPCDDCQGSGLKGGFGD